MTRKDTYTGQECEDAMALWEGVLDFLKADGETETSEAIAALRDANGTAWLRGSMLDLVRPANEAYEMARSGGFDDSYDWEFLPWYIAECIDWSGATMRDDWRERVSAKWPKPFPHMAKEFPRYDQSTLPPIPDNWQDVSWHNDSCPSFTVVFDETMGAGVTVYIECAKPEDREFPEAPRFSVHRTSRFPGHEGQLAEYVASEDWPTILSAATRMVGEFEVEG